METLRAGGGDNYYQLGEKLHESARRNMESGEMGRERSQCLGVDAGTSGEKHNMSSAVTRHCAAPCIQINTTRNECYENALKD